MNQLVPITSAVLYAAALQSLVSAGARDRLARAGNRWFRRLCAGGKRIRTIGPSRGFRRSEPLARKQTSVVRTAVPLRRDRWFESASLQSGADAVR